MVQLPFCIVGCLHTCACAVQFRVYRRFAALSQQIGELRHERNVSSQSMATIKVCSSWCCSTLEATDAHSHCNIALKDKDLREENIKKGSLLRQQILDTEVCGA